jgi:hypothetical protein
MMRNHERALMGPGIVRRDMETPYAVCRHVEPSKLGTLVRFQARERRIRCQRHRKRHRQLVHGMRNVGVRGSLPSSCIRKTLHITKRPNGRSGWQGLGCSKAWGRRDTQLVTGRLSRKRILSIYRPCYVTIPYVHAAFLFPFMDFGLMWRSSIGVPHNNDNLHPGVAKTLACRKPPTGD